jgi:hypothetical protein
MESLLAPKYYGHTHPNMGFGVTKSPDGKSPFPFTVVCNSLMVYSVPTDECFEIDKESFDRMISQK